MSAQKLSSVALMVLGIPALAQTSSEQNSPLPFQARPVQGVAADRNEWKGARKEWDSVLSDLESGMIELKSSELAQLASLGGWLRGTEALSALVLQNYSVERAELLRQPGLVDYLEKQLLGMSNGMKRGPLVAKMLDGIRTISALVKSESVPPPEKTVREIHGICEKLVRLSSQRPAELSN